MAKDTSQVLKYATKTGPKSVRQKGWRVVVKFKDRRQLYFDRDTHEEANSLRMFYNSQPTVTEARMKRKFF
jgi:hypothetical protein